MRVLLMIVLLAVTGCASVPMTPPMLDAAAKEFAVKPDQANIYFVRDSSFGSAVTVPVRVNGEYAGETAPNTYFLWQLAPGTYSITSHSGNVEQIDITVEPGRNYFIRQTMVLGLFSPSTKLDLLDDRVGRKAVSSTKRAASPLAEASPTPDS